LFWTGYSKSETALAVIRRERDGFDNTLSGLKRKTNNQNEILDVQNLDISNQVEKNKLQKEITRKSRNVRKDAQTIHDKLDRLQKQTERDIQRNEKSFGKKSMALRKNQIDFEADIVKFLEDRLWDLSTQKDDTFKEHKRLKDVKEKGEAEILIRQQALENQVRQRMQTILQGCKDTQRQFHQCVRMITERNKTVQCVALFF
jgi:hypothetical protein